MNDEPKKTYEERLKERWEQFPDEKLLHDLFEAAGGLPKPVTPEWLEKAAQHGMVAKDKLVDGRYYAGDCRNASVAQWRADHGVFVYMRTKFGSTFPEDICHPADDDGFDLFVPLHEVEPKENQKIPEGYVPYHKKLGAK